MTPPRLPRGREVRSFARRYRYQLLAAAVALVAGLAVLVVAHELFPYHSSNHDEGVYLQQAELLLDGRLRLRPGPEPLREAFRPWFFVEDDRGFYSKYTPVVAAVFAAGKLAGGYRLALLGVATANAALTYAITAEAFDRPTGVLAAAVVSGAPLFLLTSAAFLPYAPTTALNLLFAVAYVRAVRRGDARYAAVAGAAVGLAFFARPYTAVLFATPFVVHALWRLSQTIPDHPGATVRYGVVAGVGSAFVGLALAYNAVVTGSPFLFPYEVFAPRDGLGFGRRRILGHEADYTSALALRANAVVLWNFATRWFTAGPLGTVAAATGIAAVLAGVRRDGLEADTPLSDRRLRVLLLGVIPVVVAGNVYFWGNLNILGDVADPADGLITLFGPFYHFDLVPILSAFAAHGILTASVRVRAVASQRASARALKAGTVLCLALTLPAVGAAEAGALGPPVEKHASYTEKFELAYAPFEETDLAGALVFLPPEYGEWRNHPFQWLRNDPGFDGPTVYATARNPGDDFAVLSAYPDRRYYRYRYHGEWTPDPDDRVYPVLERIELRDASALTARTEVTVPDRITSASVAVSAGEAVRRYSYERDPPDTLAVNWTLRSGGVTVANPALVPRGGEGPVPVDGPAEVSLAITITEPGGGTLTYREELLVRPTEDGIVALWPPSSSICTLVSECGLDGTYVHDRPETRPDGIEMDTTIRDGNP